MSLSIYFRLLLNKKVYIVALHPSPNPNHILPNLVQWSCKQHLNISGRLVKASGRREQTRTTCTVVKYACKCVCTCVCLHVYIYFKVCVCCIYACIFISFNSERKNLAEEINALGREEHNFFSVLLLLLLLARNCGLRPHCLLGPPLVGCAHKLF